MSLDINKIKEQIEHGNTSLGIELGSTRIKAVLIGEDHTPIASGSHDWENRYVSCRTIPRERRRSSFLIFVMLIPS